MADNTQIDPKTEGGLFSLVHGISGMLVAVVLLLSILGVLTVLAVKTQAANAENYYEINQDLTALKSGSVFSSSEMIVDGKSIDQTNGTENHKMWINK